MAQHKDETAVYASGWIEGRIEDLIAGYTKANNQELLKVLTEMQEMHKTIDESLNALIQENARLRSTLRAVHEIIVSAAKVNISVDL